jgi:hypothetical protein
MLLTAPNWAVSISHTARSFSSGIAFTMTGLNSLTTAAYLPPWRFFSSASAFPMFTEPGCAKTMVAATKISAQM